MSIYKSSKKQGDAGLAVAISWFALNGCTISIPLTDSQDYDLVVEMDNKLSKVQVKTATTKNIKGNYKVGLRTRTTKNGINVFKEFNPSLTDYLFIYTSDGNKYLIPSNEIVAKNQIILYVYYDKYKVTNNSI